MKKVGILGGAFDPIHSGHLTLAQQAIDYFKFDEFHFLPSFQHPFKGKQNYLFTFEQRIELIQIAIEAEESRFKSKIKINQTEKTLSGKNFTFDTLNHFKSQNQDWEIYFLIGSDNLNLLHEWYKIEELLTNYQLIIYHRAHFDENLALHLLEKKLSPKAIESLKRNIFKTNIPDVSSSNIRELILKKEFSKIDMPENCLRKIKTFVKA